jgi:hypothetical protein
MGTRPARSADSVHFLIFMLGFLLYLFLVLVLLLLVLALRESQNALKTLGSRILTLTREGPSSRPLLGRPYGSEDALKTLRSRISEFTKETKGNDIEAEDLTIGDISILVSTLSGELSWLRDYLRRSEQDTAARCMRISGLEKALHQEVSRLVAVYLESAQQAWNSLEKGKELLKMSCLECSTLTLSLAMIAEAEVIATPRGVDLVEEAEKAWTNIEGLCHTLKSRPSIEDHLTISALRAVRADFKSLLERRLSEVENQQKEGEKGVRQRIDEYRIMAQEREIVVAKRTEFGNAMCAGIVRLNPGVDSRVKKTIAARVAQRARSAYLYSNDSSQLHKAVSGDDHAVISSLIPNLAVPDEVAETIAHIEPATIEQIENTKKWISETKFELKASDRNAVFQILNAIATAKGMEFVLTKSQPEKVISDSWNRASAFAMENDILCEGSLFLLGSACPEHHVKAISLHLKGDLKTLEPGPAAEAAFVDDVRAKLARIHKVNVREL